MAIPSILALVGLVLIVVALRAAFGGRGSTGAMLVGVFVAVLVGGVVLVRSASRTRAPANFAVVASSAGVTESGDARAQIRAARGRKSPRISAGNREVREPAAAAWADNEMPTPVKVDEPGWDDPELWGRWVGGIVFNWMRANVERNWTKSPPTVLSFPEQIVVIGRGRLDTKGRHDERHLEQLWHQVRKKGRGSAERVLGEMIRSLHEQSIPALEIIAGKLERIDARNAEQIASRILSKYGMDQTGPQHFTPGDRGPSLRQSVRYDISRDEFLSGLLEELGASRVRSGLRNVRSADHRRSMSAWKMLASFVVVWLLVIAASSVLRAAARRPRA